MATHEEVYAALIIEVRRRLFEESFHRIEKCIDMLDDEQIDWRPNSSSNSVSMLVRHICGNMRQWIISGIGGVEDDRDRAREFFVDADWSRDRLHQLLKTTRLDTETVLASSSAGDLLRKRQVQVYDETALSILIHVTEHCSYHTGQITYLTKMLTDRQTGFYADTDLG